MEVADTRNPELLKTADVLNLLNKLRVFVNGLELYPRVVVFHDRVLLSLLSKTITTGEAVCSLVENNFIEDAYSLTRVMVEAWLICRWISNKDIEERASAYVNYLSKDREYWIGITKQYFPGTKIKLSDEDLAELKQIADRFPDHRTWNGNVGARGMAKEEDAFEKDDNGAPINMLFDTEITYKWTSHYVHCTAPSIRAHAALPYTPFICFPHPQQQQHLRGLSLHNVAAYASKTAVRVLNVLRYPLSEDVSEYAMSILKKRA